MNPLSTPYSLFLFTALRFPMTRAGFWAGDRHTLKNETRKLPPFQTQRAQREATRWWARIWSALNLAVSVRRKRAFRACDRLIREFSVYRLGRRTVAGRCCSPAWWWMTASPRGCTPSPWKLNTWTHSPPLLKRKGMESVSTTWDTHVNRHWNFVFCMRKPSSPHL